MAYSQRFEGTYEYESKALLEEAWQEAFSDESPFGESDFTVEGLTISVDLRIYAPASSYFDYWGTLSILADNACAGEMRLHIWGDAEEIETIKARNLPEKRRQAGEKERERKALEAVKPLAGLKFIETAPADAFKIDEYYKQFGLEVSLRKPKFFHCSKCKRKRLIRPDKIMPKWPYNKPLESCFDLPLKKAFDLKTPESGKLTYDFTCKQCHFPIRLIFSIEISREDHYYPIISKVLEVETGYEK